MSRIYFISGPCGCGKTTFTDAYARHLVRQEHKTVYVIHGDDFHTGFIEPEDKGDFFVDGQASDRVLWENIVLTADTEELERRIRGRGDADLVERALFLKKELEAMPENRGHLYNNTGKTPEDVIRDIVPDRFQVR